MTITEANQTNAGGIDQDAIARAVETGMTRAMQQGSPAAATSEFDALFNQIKSAEGSDQDSLLALKQMFDAKARDLEKNFTAKQREEVAKGMAFQRDKTFESMISMVLDPLISSDESLKEYSDVFQQRIIKRFFNDEAYQKSAKRFENFDIDTDALKKLATEEVNKFNRGRNLNDMKAKGASGMGGSENTDEKTSEGRENLSGEEMDVEELSQKERDLYYASIGTAQRLHMDRNSKEALAFARGQVQKLRAGEAKAKAKGLKPLK